MRALPLTLFRVPSRQVILGVAPVAQVDAQNAAVSSFIYSMELPRIGVGIRHKSASDSNASRARAMGVINSSPRRIVTAPGGALVFLPA
jgi:hypothetical protein